MKKFLALTGVLTVAAMMTMAGIALSCDHGAAKAGAMTCPAGSGTTKAMVPASGEKLVLLTVAKMKDDAGATAVTKSLAAVSGVSDVVVNLHEGTAKVTYNPAMVKPETLKMAVEKTGYPAEVAPATTMVTAKSAAATEDKKGAGCGMQSTSCIPGN